MNKWKSLVLSLGLALLFSVALPSFVMADDWDKATRLTFSEPARFQAWPFKRVHIGSHLPTANPIGMLFRSGMPTGYTW